MEKISRKGFLKVAAAAAMSGVTAGALAACNSAASSSTAASGDAIYTAGTYTGQDSDVSTVGVVITVCASADANEAVVYEITKFLNSEEGISILGNVNSGFANYMTGPESGIAGIELELHPGAARYYKEAGVA